MNIWGISFVNMSNLYIVRKQRSKGSKAFGEEAIRNLGINIVRGRSALSDVSSDISPSPLYIPPHHR